MPGLPKTGVDDLLVSADGIELATKAITTAKPFHQFELEHRQQQERTEFIGTPVTSRFLDQDPSAVLPADGILGIRLPKGRGKTSGVFRKLAAEGKDQLRLVMLVPLRRLRDSAALQAKAVGIELRTFAASHPDTTDLGLQAIKQGQHRDKNWTLCAESLMHVTDEMLAGATVGVDEARQLTTGILESETFKGQLRDDVIKRLLQKLKLAQRVILLDADLDDATLRFWRWLVCGGGAIASPQVQLWYGGIDEKPPGFPFQMLGGKADDAERFAIQLALSDRKVLIATDSAERAERIEKALKKERPTLRVLALTSKRTGTRDAKAFFADPSQAIRNWDCVVTSHHSGLESRLISVAVLTRSPCFSAASHSMTVMLLRRCGGYETPPSPASFTALNTSTRNTPTGTTAPFVIDTKTRCFRFWRPRWQSCRGLLSSMISTPPSMLQPPRQG